MCNVFENAVDLRWDPPGEDSHHRHSHQHGGGDGGGVNGQRMWGQNAVV